MKNIKLSYQNYGSSILLFIEGANEEETHGKYLSLYNWNATSSEPTWVADNVISCWSSIERLKNYFFNRRCMELVESSPKFGVKGGVSTEAHRLAAEDFSNVQSEKYRIFKTNYDFHTLGTITAERPDEDYKDFCISKGFQEA